MVDVEDWWFRAALLELDHGFGKGQGGRDNLALEVVDRKACLGFLGQAIEEAFKGGPGEDHPDEFPLLGLDRGGGVEGSPPLDDHEFGELVAQRVGDAGQHLLCDGALAEVGVDDGFRVEAEFVTAQGEEDLAVGSQDVGKVEARIDLEGVDEGTELFGVLGDDGLGDTVGVRHEAEGLKLFRFDLDQGFVGRLASVKELVGELLVEGTRNETADNKDRHHGEDEQDKDVWCDDLSGNRAGDQLHDQVVDAAGEVADACEALGGRPRQGKHVAF